MRAPVYKPAFTPVDPTHARIVAPSGPTEGGMLGRLLIAGGAEVAHADAVHRTLQRLSEETAARSRALQDQAAFHTLVDAYTGLDGSAAVAGQAQALKSVDQIRSDGQASLGTPAMVDAYDAHLGPALAEATARIHEHALNQVLNERQAVMAQELNLAQQRAAADWREPARFIQGLTRVADTARQQGATTAGDGESTPEMRSAVGTAVAQAIDRALRAGEPEFARHILAGWSDTLTPDARQTAIARVEDANGRSDARSIIAAASAGFPAAATSAEAPAPVDGSIAIAAPDGAAIHPVVGGTVIGITGPAGRQTITLAHADGSQTAYHGVGLPAVSAGDMVTAQHVIGSASPDLAFAWTKPEGDTGDSAALLNDAGGPAAIVGSTSTPRAWNTAAILQRIGTRADLSAAQRSLASDHAVRQAMLDHANLAQADVAAGREVVAQFANEPDQLAQVADIPHDLASRLAPATLAILNQALQASSRTARSPSPDNAVALRLELQRRVDPEAFAQVNLAHFIGQVHPSDLVSLASDQGAIETGQPAVAPPSPRRAILDAIARHETVKGSPIADELLPAVHRGTDTLLRLDQPRADTPQGIDQALSDAIQSLDT